jgi:alkanesulfonate monooxygenase SsuD/methylene tetrahydromethanopterin reductase-like flavin-dependent oxidoreductase (luciferase family)
MADHFVPWADFQAEDTDTPECWTTISCLAGAFPKLQFGSIVLCQSYRNPALLAKMAATLQVLTGGRLILGIGAGWKEDEYRAYGYDFPKDSVRIAQLAEAVQIIRRMWTETPPTSFEGQYYRIKDATCEPRPDPPPPIMIGGGGERLLLRVVAEQADWWNYPGGSVELYAHKLDVLRGHCRAVGRDYDEILKTWACELVAIAETEAEAKRMAEGSPFRGDSDIVGTPEQVADQLRRFTDLGVEHFILRFANFPDPAGAELFADTVIPQFRR